MQEDINDLHDRLSCKEETIIDQLSKIVSLQQTLETKSDLENQVATSQDHVMQLQSARESLQSELEKQKQSAYIDNYTDKIARRD